MTHKEWEFHWHRKAHEAAEELYVLLERLFELKRQADSYRDLAKNAAREHRRAVGREYRERCRQEGDR